MKRLICLLLALSLTLTGAAALADAATDFRYARRVWAFTGKGPARYQAQNGMYGFVSRTGQIAIPATFEEAHDFSDGGLAAVRRGSLWGYIDSAGTLVIDYAWEAAGPFSEGLAAVKKDGKWGYIDKTGREVISCRYASAGAFRDGAAKVTVESSDAPDQTYFTDKLGGWVSTPAWASEAVFTIDGSGTVLSRNGRVIAQTNVKLGFEHDEIRKVSGCDSLWVIRRDGRADSDTYILYDAAVDRILMQDMAYISTVCAYGKIAVRSDEFAYYVNVKGEMVSGGVLSAGPYDFTETYDFGLAIRDGKEYGCARVRRKDGKYIYLMSKNSGYEAMRDPGAFDHATDMVSDSVIVWRNSTTGWDVTDGSFK